jgi:cyclopropane fatty-acyl-phospholipid synthase-like methyltransferase
MAMGMGDYRHAFFEAYVRSGQAPAVSDPRDLERRAPYLRRLIERHFPPDRRCRILDLGCGSGALLYFAQAAGYESVRGIDASPEQVANAKRLGLNCVRLGDALPALMAEPAEGVDVLIAFDLLEHFDKGEVMRFLAAARRALTSGGILIVHVPNAGSPFGGSIRYGDFTHELAFTQRSLAQIGLIAGFSRVDCYEDAPIPHGLRSFGRWLLWPLVRGMYRLLTAIETGSADVNAIFSQNLLATMKK